MYLTCFYDRNVLMKLFSFYNIILMFCLGMVSACGGGGGGGDGSRGQDLGGDYGIKAHFIASGGEFDDVNEEVVFYASDKFPKYIDVIYSDDGGTNQQVNFIDSTLDSPYWFIDNDNSTCFNGYQYYIDFFQEESCNIRYIPLPLAPVFSGQYPPESLMPMDPLLSGSIPAAKIMIGGISESPETIQINFADGIGNALSTLFVQGVVKNQVVLDNGTLRVQHIPVANIFDENHPYESVEIMSVMYSGMSYLGESISQTTGCKIILTESTDVVAPSNPQVCSLLVENNLEEVVYSYEDPKNYLFLFHINSLSSEYQWIVYNKLDFYFDGL